MQIAAWTAVVLVAIFVWWTNSAHLSARLAWDGFSPTYMVADLLHPHWFTHDFPSGAEELFKSAPMAIYLLTSMAGISAVVTMKALIGVEICLLAGAAYWSLRRIFPKASRETACVVALLVIAGSLRMPDLGRWGAPTYGWVYGYANAAIMVGVAAALEKRFVLSALALALAFVSHPVLGVLGCAFAGAVILADWRNLEWHRLVLPLLLFLIIAGSWFGFIVASSGLGGGGIPNDIYIALTRLESAHWYPIDQGLFWDRHWERLFPFLAGSLLLLCYLPDAKAQFSGRRAQMAAGFLLSLVLTCAGIAISRWFPEPFLIKLALQRASSIYLLMALFFVVPGLWRDALDGPLIRAATAVLILISAFLCSYGVPVVFALAMTAIVVADDLRARGWTMRTRLLVGTSVFLIGLWLVYAFAGIVDWVNPQYWGLSSLSLPRLLMVVFAVGFIVFTRKWKPVPGLALLAALAILAALSVHANDKFARHPDVLAKAESYLDVQLWARKNTPVGTLFMPDPTHYYGWRGFSLRPSFGNLREWLYTGWAYNSRQDVLAEGETRLRALGIDLNTYLHMPGPRHEIGDLLTTDLRKRYYSMSCADLTVLSRRFGIAYFVFDRQWRKSVPPGCRAVYGNENYLVIGAPAISGLTER